jgi:hypothetical protein
MLQHLAGSLRGRRRRRRLITLTVAPSVPINPLSELWLWSTKVNFIFKKEDLTSFYYTKCSSTAPLHSAEEQLFRIKEVYVVLIVFRFVVIDGLQDALGAAGTPRCHAIIERNVVAFAYAARGKSEPIGENSPTSV